MIESCSTVCARVPSLTLEEVEDAVLKAATFFGPVQRNALQVTAAEIGHQFRKTGRRDFDDFLGGLATGKILELDGPTAVGKTQLCMWLAVQMAVQDPAARVVYCYSNPMLAAQRMASFFPPDQSLENRNAAMARIELVDCGRADRLMTYLHELREQVLAQQRGVPHNTLPVACVLLDSVAPLVSVCIGKQPYGHALMMSMRAVLKEIAAVANCPVVLTNFTTAEWSDSDKTAMRSIKGALGPTWATVADVRVFMTPTSEAEKTFLTMPTIGQQRSCVMHMTATGLLFSPVP